MIRYQRCRTDELYLLLHRISRNRLVDFRKSPRAQIERQLAFTDANIEDYRSCADPIRNASARQMLNSFYQTLSTLPQCPREVYLLNRVTGMSYSQIAQHRGVTPKTVEKQTSRALQGLRKEFDPTAYCMDKNS
ncbi:RNA polymerase sigma factor [Stenotrophomonas maltophilia]|nr:RNA polymerase sigma factor [Stenotrophomonas maltophilia]